MSRTSVVTTPEASPAKAPTALISRRCTVTPCPPPPSHVRTVSAGSVSRYRSEHLGSVHLAGWARDEPQACAVGVAEVQRDLAVFAELHARVDQFGAELVPSLRLDADRDVVQATQHLLIRTQIETREIEEGQEIAVADVEEECQEPG
jgi:hypothetical protein